MNSPQVARTNVLENLQVLAGVIQHIHAIKMNWLGLIHQHHARVFKYDDIAYKFLAIKRKTMIAEPCGKTPEILDACITKLGQDHSEGPNCVQISELQRTTAMYVQGFGNASMLKCYYEALLSKVSFSKIFMLLKNTLLEADCSSDPYRI